MTRLENEGSKRIIAQDIVKIEAVKKEGKNDTERLVNVS